MKFLYPASIVITHPTDMKGKARVRCNVWGNWWGYIGTRRVHEIGASSFDADDWLKEQQKIQEAK